MGTWGRLLNVAKGKVKIWSTDDDDRLSVLDRELSASQKTRAVKKTSARQGEVFSRASTLREEAEESAGADTAGPDTAEPKAVKRSL